MKKEKNKKTMRGIRDEIERKFRDSDGVPGRDI